jgi:hypothetical protein
MSAGMRSITMEGMTVVRRHQKIKEQNAKMRKSSPRCGDSTTLMPDVRFRLRRFGRSEL